MGIVILGGPTDVSSYKQITQSVYGVEVKDNWMETQFGVRILYRRPIEENKDADFNVWKKIMFDAESGKIGINIDVNSSLRTPIDYLDYKPSEIWKPIKDLVEECINAFTVE